MNRKVVIALAAISLMLLSSALPHSAQERQVGNRAPVGERSQQPRQIVNIADAEKLRGKISVAYMEVEAVIRYLAEFEVARQSLGMSDYEETCADLVEERKRIDAMTVTEFMAQPRSLPDVKTADRVIEILRRIKNDEGLNQAMTKADRYFQEGKIRNSAVKTSAANSRGVIAAPALFPLTCKFSDPRDFPTGADLALANGLALAAHLAADLLPEIFVVLGESIPNPIQIALLIAAFALDEIHNMLQGEQVDGAACEVMRIFIEEQLSADGDVFKLQMQDFYMRFSYLTVVAAITKARAQGITERCEQAKLNAASQYFNGNGDFTGTGDQRIIALKLLAEAYQNIGASECRPLPPAQVQSPAKVR